MGIKAKYCPTCGRETANKKEVGTFKSDFDVYRCLSCNGVWSYEPMPIGVSYLDAIGIYRERRDLMTKAYGKMQSAKDKEIYKLKGKIRELEDKLNPRVEE